MKKKVKIDGSLKLEIVLEAIKGHKTANEIASEYGIHPQQISLWKEQLLKSGDVIYADKRQKENKTYLREIEDMKKLIGEYAYQNDWLKKKISKHGIV